jgi:hypothetical protein
MFDFKFSLSTKPPKPKQKVPGQKTVVVVSDFCFIDLSPLRTDLIFGVSQRVSGRGGAGNIRRTIHSDGLAQVKSNNTTVTAATAATRATRHSTTTGFSAKSPSTLSEEVTNADYDNIVSPAGREVGLPRNKVCGSIKFLRTRPSTMLCVQTTTSGRGGAGNAYDHVLEKGVFERVIAYEHILIRQYRKMQAPRDSQRTGRGGAGNVRSSTGDLNKDGSESRPGIFLPHFLALLTMASFSVLRAVGRLESKDEARE